MDEEQLINKFKEVGIYKKSKEELSRIKTFEGIACGMSIYLFSKENIFRELCYKAWKSKVWEPIVQVLITLSSLKLAVDTYIEKGTDAYTTSQSVDNIINLIFLAEMMTKIFAMGLIMDEGSYLRESWNRLDFFIVMSSMVDMLTANLEIGIVKLMRVLRVLRPLRFINSNKDLKMVVVALLESVNPILSVMIVIAIIFLIFAILGMNFFGGKFFYCSIDPYVHMTENNCRKNQGQWSKYDFNFDDVGQGMLSLFVVSNLEAWPDIML